MNPINFVQGLLHYSVDMIPNVLPVNSVRSRQLEKPEGYINASLHTHPMIYNCDDADMLFRNMARNDVDLCAIVKHGAEKDVNLSFWGARARIKCNPILADHLSLDEFDEEDPMFRVSYQDKLLTLVPGYEISVRMGGVRGMVDMISLMPDHGFEKDPRVKPGMDFNDFMKANEDYNGISVGAHPYTIHGKLMKFRFANADERRFIQSLVFNAADVVDCVSDNVAWMAYADRLVAKDYIKKMGRKPLCNDDAHATGPYTSREIGRSGNLFKMQMIQSGDMLRESLKKKILADDFLTYHHYTTPLRFLSGVAFNLQI